MVIMQRLPEITVASLITEHPTDVSSYPEVNLPDQPNRRIRIRTYGVWEGLSAMGVPIQIDADLGLPLLIVWATVHTRPVLFNLVNNFTLFPKQHLQRSQIIEPSQFTLSFVNLIFQQHPPILFRFLCFDGYQPHFNRNLENQRKIF